MKLSILIPVYNEQNTITKVLQTLVQIRLNWDKEIIVINDGSEDKTADKIERFLKKQGKNIQVTLISHRKNSGKGKAVQSGIKKATGNYILIQDADLEYNPREIPKLLKPVDCLEKDSRIAVYGSRFAKNNAIVISRLYLWGNKFLTMLTNILYGTNLTDMETCYKLIPTSFMKKMKLKSKRFDMEPEITAKLINSGYNIKEIPISYKGRSRLAGKKITLTDAFSAVKTLILLRFGQARSAIS